MFNFTESAVRLRVENCLKTVSNILDTNKAQAVKSVGNVAHNYDDKYLLADYVTRMSIECVIGALNVLCGLTPSIATLQGWSSQHRPVSLKFEQRQKCRLVKEIEKDIELATISSEGVATTITTKVKEFVFLIEEDYVLSAHSGVGDNPEQMIQILTRSSQIEATLRNSAPPFYESTLDSFDVDISWLLSRLDRETGGACFSINRSATDCATPRQNADVHAALAFNTTFAVFCSKMYAQMRHLHDVQSRYQGETAAKFDLSQVSPQGIFNPIVPLFEAPKIESPAQLTSLD